VIEEYPDPERRKLWDNATDAEVIESSYNDIKTHIVRELVGSMELHDLSDYVREWANADGADVDEDDGKIWIEGPMDGHWLNENEFWTFIEWMNKR